MAAPQIAPIDPSNLRDTAYRALRDAFIAGAFAPGDSVSLRDLAAQFGVSMTPVREAVRRLVAEGALVDTPSRTLVVPPFDPVRARDLMAARKALETLVLDQVMDRISPEELAALQAILDEPPTIPGRPNLSQNYRFHFTLYRIAGSEVLLPLVEALWVQYGAYLNLIIRSEQAQVIEENAHHVELISALRGGGRLAARAALVADIERSFSFLLTEQCS